MTHILQHKSWHVWSTKNIEKVKKDEKKHKEEQEQLRREQWSIESNQRYESLKSRANSSSGEGKSSNKRDYDHYDYEDLYNDDSIQKKQRKDEISEHNQVHQQTNSDSGLDFLETMEREQFKEEEVDLLKKQTELELYEKAKKKIAEEKNIDKHTTFLGKKTPNEPSGIKPWYCTTQPSSEQTAEISEYDIQRYTNQKSRERYRKNNRNSQQKPIEEEKESYTVAEIKAAIETERKRRHDQRKDEEDPLVTMNRFLDQKKKIEELKRKEEERKIPYKWKESHHKKHSKRDNDNNNKKKHEEAVEATKSKKSSSSSSKSKTIEELRQERIERERKEKERVTALIFSEKAQVVGPARAVSSTIPQNHNIVRDERLMNYNSSYSQYTGAENRHHHQQRREWQHTTTSSRVRGGDY